MIVSIPQLQRMGVFQEKTKKIVSIAYAFDTRNGDYSFNHS